MSNFDITRRKALGLGGAFLAGCSLARTEAPSAGESSVREMIVGRVWSPKRRLPPGDELVNSLEYEEQARFVLPENVYAGIAGTNVEPFNRITFMPRTNIPILDMDLTVPLFGEPLFTPMIAGPIPYQRAYHAEGELATVRGAEAANTVVVVSSRSSVPLEQIARQSTGPLWFSVYATDSDARERVLEATALGAKALFITVGASYEAAGSRPRSGRPQAVDWRAVDSVRGGVTIPIVLKGILTPEDAGQAIERGFQGIVVSDHGADGLTGGPAPLDALSPVVEMVGGRIPVLADGSFRRGSDVLKGLILGADAVLLNRPVAWSLASYGADGVQWLFEKMQTELARNFAMVGAARPDQLTRSLVRIHTRATA
jgi:4-hydroxymandelate oxidase